MGCLFCVMHERLPEGKHAFDPVDLCPKHLATTGIPEYLAAHPDGEHTTTCGCVTLDALKQEAVEIIKQALVIAPRAVGDGGDGE